MFIEFLGHAGPSFHATETTHIQTKNATNKSNVTKHTWTHSYRWKPTSVTPGRVFTFKTRPWHLRAAPSGLGNGGFGQKKWSGGDLAVRLLGRFMNRLSARPSGQVFPKGQPE